MAFYTILSEGRNYSMATDSTSIDDTTSSLIETGNSLIIDEIVSRGDAAARVNHIVKTKIAFSSSLPN